MQDNDCRSVVAAAKGDINAIFRNQSETKSELPAYLADRGLYACKPNIDVRCFTEQCRLPDPWERWTDMIYSVKGGRNNDGEVIIWANGKKIAAITGDIGNDDDGDKQKVKFGVYRDVRPETTTFYLDNFRQGSSYQDVDPTTFPK